MLKQKKTMRSRKSGVLVKFLVFFDFLQSTLSVRFVFGECPLFFNELCSSDAVRFTLSMKSEDRTVYYDLDPIYPRLPNDFNILIPLKVVVHGYGGLSVDISSTNVTKAYQDVGFNVIIDGKLFLQENANLKAYDVTGVMILIFSCYCLVDWEPLGQVPCYTTAYLNTWHVAQCLSQLVVSLIPLGLGPELIHVIGFSLGAHISGLAGNNLKRNLGISFFRITGLDPALPFFATLKNDWKLDSSDADFVDVIHTSAGTFGKLEATGHVDFYVNGGSLQPSCYNKQYPPLCSHIMAGLYFAESIKKSVFGGEFFLARKCENLAHYMLGLCNSGKTAVMGENVYFSSQGSYYLETAEYPPFALGLKPYYLKPKKFNDKYSFRNKLLSDFFNSLC